MKRADGSSRFAFVTFLMMNDSYLASALLMAYGLKKQNSQADTVCMVTEEIDDDTIIPLIIQEKSTAAALRSCFSSTAASGNTIMPRMPRNR